jgi:hypothetical protein
MTETPTQSGTETALAVDRDLAVRLSEVTALTRAVEDRMVAMYRGGGLLGSLYTGHWHEDARQQAIAARRKALADPMPDPRNIEEGVYVP